MGTGGKTPPADTTGRRSTKANIGNVVRIVVLVLLMLLLAAVFVMAALNR